MPPELLEPTSCGSYPNADTTLEETRKPTVKLPPSRKPPQLLDSTSETGTLFTRYLSHRSKQEKDVQNAAQKPSTEISTLLTNESNANTEDVEGAKGSKCPTYSNIDQTLEEVNALRAQNQENSPLLKLPTELLAMIWKMTTESTKATRVHGIVSRQASASCVLSLVHSCSLLHNALYPEFVG